MTAPWSLILLIGAILLCFFAFVGSWRFTPVNEPYRWPFALGWLGISFYFVSLLVK